MSTNALYKGVGLIFLGGIALGFWFWRKRRGEPASLGFYVFLGLTLFILGYGIYLVIVQPTWWQVPRVNPSVY